MRIIGIMLIAAAAVYGGGSYAALKREQLNELNALCHTLRLMQDELETRALPLPELAAQLDTRTENAGKALLSGLLRRLPELGSRDFQNIWEECVTESVKHSEEAARLLLYARFIPRQIRRRQPIGGDTKLPGDVGKAAHHRRGGSAADAQARNGTCSHVGRADSYYAYLGEWQWILI